jgi:hypothetical protein
MLRRRLPLLLLPAAAAAGAVADQPHMNNIPGGYKIGNPLPGYEDKQWTFRGDYFEVATAEMHTRYSEVFWTSLPSVPLPADVVAKYKDDYIVITGFEVDVKRINNATGQEESVPVYESYNHHYGPAICSSYAEPIFDEFGQPTGPDHGHGKTLLYRVKDGASPPPGAKLAENFVHGNGNEHRQIYHGASAGFGQVIYSPASFNMVAMQINTNFNGSGVPGGPMPKFSRDHAPPDVPWNPILECPCTTRIVKQLGSLSAQLSGSCAKLPIAAADCFAGASQAFGLAAVAQNVSSNSAALTPGCTVARAAAGGDSLVVTWNENRTSAVPCGSGATSAAGHTADLVDVRVAVDAAADLATITLSGPADVWFGVGFGATAMQDLPYVIVVEATGDKGVVSERKLADHAPGTALPASVTVVSSSVTAGVRTVVVTRKLAGATVDYYTFSLAHATIPFINAVGDTPTFQQHKQRATNTLRLVPTAATASSCLCAGAEGTIDGYALNANCVGEPASDLLSTNNPTCQVSTYVGGLACCRHGTFLLDADQEIPDHVDNVFFRFRFYYEDLVVNDTATASPTTHRNDSSSSSGGGSSNDNNNNNNNNNNKAVVVKSKTTTTATPTRAIYHVEWAGNGCDSGISGPSPHGCTHIEFDVTPNANATAKASPSPSPSQQQQQQQQQSFQSTFAAGSMLATNCAMTSPQCMDRNKLGASGKIELVMASAHCHAPNCIRQELWDVDANELLCEVVPVHGGSEQLYDEAGYLYAPPCLWGSDEGLKAPPQLGVNTTMRMVTVFDNSYYHAGQMGIWQMKAAFVE